MSHQISVEIFKPAITLSRYVQGIWVADSNHLKISGTTKHFISDAASGFIFVLEGSIAIDGQLFEQGIVWQPTRKTAYTIRFSPNSKVVGFRFKPAIGLVICSELSTSTCQLAQVDSPVEGLKLQLTELFNELQHKSGKWHKISTVYRWLTVTIDFARVVPESVSNLLQMISPLSESTYGEQLSKSPRQLQRQFSRWLNMTPTYYKRLIRVHQSVVALRSDTEINLATFALAQGFSDQAHMTREFKAIANITPYRFLQHCSDTALAIRPLTS
ncbi:MAG: helix-turn-helix domain-containing protein [Psychrobium sp.]